MAAELAAGNRCRVVAAVPTCCLIRAREVECNDCRGRALRGRRTWLQTSERGDAEAAVERGYCSQGARPRDNPQPPPPVGRTLPSRLGIASAERSPQSVARALFPLNAMRTLLIASSWTYLVNPYLIPTYSRTCKFLRKSRIKTTWHTASAQLCSGHIPISLLRPIAT